MSPGNADGRYRFQNFVVGAANRLAVSAARAVAQSPGAAYNPLFIYSNSGLGKTHLLLATGQLATELAPALRTSYVALGEMVDELHGAVAAGRVAEFRERFRDIDMLLLDDVQFLAGRRETQTELLRLFDVLRRGGRQLVLASDRPPAEISELDAQLLTRFSGGLIVDIDKPDYETRVAILRRKCEEFDINFVAGVTEAVARIGHGNVRELEGALIRLMAFQQLGEGQVVPATVPKILGGRYTPAPGMAAIPDEFSSFVSDLAAFVSERVDEGTQRLADAVAMWSEAGYVTELLEGTARGQVEEAIAAFEGAVKHLRELEAAAADADPSLAGAEVFRDPSRIPEAENLVAMAVSRKELPPVPVEVLTRESYEIAPCNQFAVHAGEAVVREPGRRYNPLVMHGEPGVGKSHLLHAIGNGLAKVRGTRVACAKAQLFVDEFIAALEAGTLERWRARWRDVDALLLDDAQVVAGTEAAQVELFNLFNTLHASGKQIVLAFDCSPKELETLDDRLRSRFAGGLVVEIRPPDSTLRQRLYRTLLQRLGHVVPTDVLSYLARRECDDVREIIVTADLLAREAQNNDSPITLGFARRLLDDVPMTPVRSATPIRSSPATTGAPTPAVTPAVITTPVSPTAAVRMPFAITPGIKDVDTFFLDRDKTIWEWPELGGRVIEEMG